MATRVAWVLNLDADLELASGERYAPTNAVRAAMAPHVERLAATLLGPDDVLVDETSPRGVAEGLSGRAFCPTRRARSILRRAGAVPEPHPPFEVLRVANGRAFCASLGQTLPGATFARDLETAASVLAAPPPEPVARCWRVKRAFGMAGRGHRVIDPGPLSDGDHTFLRAGIAEGGVQIEPNVAIDRELGLHGMLDPTGAVVWGRLVAQTCDARGQWLATTIAEDVEPEIERTIAAEARRVAEALHAMGYFGPFGIDAFTYRDRDGGMRLQPRSEINARYSMGFPVGMRDDSDE